MKTYPLKSISIDEAKRMQFKLIDLITKEFNGDEILKLGDLGVVQPQNQPETTRKVERVFANFFDAEDCVLLIGSGTGAIKEAISSILKKRRILVHSSPIYSTTDISLEQLGVEKLVADYNNYDELKEILKKQKELDGVLIQYTRQTLEDRYDIEDVIKIIHENNNIPIITDDNYAVMKVEKIGVQLGADLSCFSLFKLLGPESVGCVVGKKKYIDIIRNYHYSGGSQVQGFISMEAMRSLVYTPVALAIQAEETQKIVDYINGNNLPFVKSAVIANSQSRVVLVEFKEAIAEEVLKYAKEFGAASHPVGSESKYEIVPMFYKISGSMREKYINAEKYWIRINPMRGGSDTVLRILKLAIGRCTNVS